MHECVVCRRKEIQKPQVITINGVQKVIETHDNDEDGGGDGANTKVYLTPTTGIQVSVPGDDADDWASRANGFGRPPALIPAAAGETSAGTEIPLSDVSFGGFDKVLRCTGWRMDTSIFDPELAPIFEYADDIYPTMESPFSVEYTGVDAGGNETVAYAPTSHWEHPTVPGLYFAGALMRPSEAGADASAEGWSIASLRHRVKALHRILELRNHGMCDPDEQLAWGDRHDARVKTEGCIGWEIPGVLGMPWPVHEVAFLGTLLSADTCQQTVSVFAQHTATCSECSPKHLVVVRERQLTGGLRRAGRVDRAATAEPRQRDGRALARAGRAL